MSWSIVFMVLGIVLISAIAKVQREKYRGGHLSADSQAMPAEAIASREEVRQLKERIAVLERVITDNHGSVDLSRQIDELRDR